MPGGALRPRDRAASAWPSTGRSCGPRSPRGGAQRPRSPSRSVASSTWPWPASSSATPCAAIVIARRLRDRPPRRDRHRRGARRAWSARPRRSSTPTAWSSSSSSTSMINAKPADIPSSIEVDISGLDDRRRHPGRRPEAARRRHHRGRRRGRGGHRRQTTRMERRGRGRGGGWAEGAEAATRRRRRAPEELGPAPAAAPGRPPTCWSSAWATPVPSTTAPATTWGPRSSRLLANRHGATLRGARSGPWWPRPGSTGG